MKNEINLKSKYKNKLFSILGDSISTLDGYSQPQCGVFYTGIQKCKSDVFGPEDTWWGQVVERLGGVLLINDSFSGSMVARHKACTIPSYSCSDERTSALQKDGQLPDVIMVFMGTNDWGYGIKTIPDSDTDEGDISIFSTAYKLMLKKLTKNYPAAEIWCLTLPVSTRKNDNAFVFPYCYGGHHIEEYCDVIRSSAKEYDCRLIDLYRSPMPHDTIDGFHPSADGMKTLSDAVIAEL